MQTLRIQSQADSKAGNKLAFNWLDNNPRRWCGKQVLSKRNGQTYTIRDVMPSGKVQLERKWVLYNSDVQTVRLQYEPASP